MRKLATGRCAKERRHRLEPTANDEAKFMTGQVISPNGGWYMSQ
jgi:hypothetical protein